MFLSLYPKISAIASGATPIGSAGRAPMIFIHEYWSKESKRRFRKFQYSHQEGTFYQSRLNNPNISYTEISQTRLRHMILELRHRNKTRMPWLKYITKVRPEDPSCVARYTHMDALCWYISVSTMRRKILVDALGTLRTTGIHSL
jgi:hypothetical protein